MLDLSLLRLPGMNARPAVKSEIERLLFGPLQDLLARPKKEVRGGLVEIGYELALGSLESSNGGVGSVSRETKAGLAACAQSIEALHTGSLIIDDIEDSSVWRRGGPSLHMKYGVPTALNAGNWLYFFAFEKIRQTRLPAEVRNRLYELMEEILLEAHTGQALDVGTDISSKSVEEIPDLCRASLELKSGALMSLALRMGAVFAGTDFESDMMKWEGLKKFGIEFGMSLQMFDDLGNVRVDRPTAKHLEDLSLRRPSYVWWCLAEKFPAEKDRFITALTALPDVLPLKEFLHEVPLLETGFSRALGFQQRALRELENNLHPKPSTFQKIQAIAEKVAHAYS